MLRSSWSDTQVWKNIFSIPDYKRKKFEWSFKLDFYSIAEQHFAVTRVLFHCNQYYQIHPHFYHFVRTVVHIRSLNRFYRIHISVWRRPKTLFITREFLLSSEIPTYWVLKIEFLEIIRKPFFYYKI